MTPKLGVGSRLTQSYPSESPKQKNEVACFANARPVNQELLRGSSEEQVSGSAVLAESRARARRPPVHRNTGAASAVVRANIIPTSGITI